MVPSHRWFLHRTSSLYLYIYIYIYIHMYIYIYTGVSYVYIYIHLNLGQSPLQCCDLQLFMCMLSDTHHPSKLHLHGPSKPRFPTRTRHTQTKCVKEPSQHGIKHCIGSTCKNPDYAGLACMPAALGFENADYGVKAMLVNVLTLLFTLRV